MILQEDIDQLIIWSNKWLLKFHPDKCKVLKVGPVDDNIEYTLNNTKLEDITHEKDIGVTVDKDLKFEMHMQAKINKATSVMGIIRRSFSYMDCSIFTKLYKALIRPHMEYANPVWSPSLKKNIIAVKPNPFDANYIGDLTTQGKSLIIIHQQRLDLSLA